jgi:dTDP-glucose 4,6-dehydratase
LTLPRILVTGGLGFIGSNFVKFALDMWPTSEIVNLDAVSFGAVPKNVNDVQGLPRYQFTKGDITDRKLVEQLMKEIDMVIHFAAETHVDRSIANPESFLQSNVVGTFTLLDAARKADVGKFVHISTDEVYGSVSSGGSFEENDRLRSSNPYSASKASAEMFVEAYWKTYGLKTVTMRCTNNFGPFQFPEKFIPKAIISALLERNIPIYGKGMQIRDWIYVLDFCEAVRLAAEKGEPGEIYNVSAGNELPNIEVANRILGALHKPSDMIQFVQDRPGHDFRYSLDSSRIRSQLGWKPQHAFDEALKETVSWFVQNESWWRPLISDEVLSPTPWKLQW